METSTSTAVLDVPSESTFSRNGTSISMLDGTSISMLSINSISSGVNLSLKRNEEIIDYIQNVEGE